jgi:hypothetical protein
MKSNIEKNNDKSNIEKNNNKNVYNIMKTQGIQNASNNMFIHPKTGEPTDYVTMRCFYG